MQVGRRFVLNSKQVGFTVVCFSLTKNRQADLNTIGTNFSFLLFSTSESIKTNFFCHATYWICAILNDQPIDKSCAKTQSNFFLQFHLIFLSQDSFRLLNLKANYMLFSDKTILDQAIDDVMFLADYPQVS